MFMAILNQTKLKNAKMKLNSQINQLMNVPIGKHTLTKDFSTKLYKERYVKVEPGKLARLSKNAFKTSVSRF